MDKLKIDQVAVQSGLTKRTIRYYEEIGILMPPQRSEGGIRYYNQEHIELLKRIKDIKDALGLSLEELQHFISLSNIIEAQKIDYKQSFERTERKEKLFEIINTLDEELNIIKRRIEKIEKVQNNLKDLRSRAQALVERLELEVKEFNTE